MKTGVVFRKQYGDEIFGKQINVNYIYPREKLTAEPIFPYFVLDGGAFNFANDRFGTVNSDELLELTMSGKLFDEFKLNGVFNWERSFAYTADTGFTKKYEWQIWPQRLYMTLPVAHAYLRTGDMKYANAWMKIVKSWDEAHPYQPFEPLIHYIKTDMVWRDMQVAWRTLSLLHGVFMLQDAPFTCDEWKYLYDFIELHANHLYYEAIDRLDRNLAQNHVLQIGVALIMAGAMFPELKNAAEFIRIGSDTVQMNLKGAIYSDGGSNEDSPSYSHFIARLYLESYLLLKNNNLTMIEGLRESIVKQYEWLYHCMAPSGKVLRISDSYGMDAEADIRRAEELIELDFPRERGDRLFPESAVAILRRGSLTLVADAMEYLGGHQHSGRPQILLFHDKEPVLVDAGCSNYDRWEMYSFLRTMNVHNVVMCPKVCGKIDVIDPKIQAFDPKNGVIRLSCDVISGEVSYKWDRKLTLSEKELLIEDVAFSEKEIDWVSYLHFARNDTHLSDDRLIFRQLTDDYIMIMRSDKEIVTELTPVMNDDNKTDYAVTSKISYQGKEFKNFMKIGFEKR